MNLPPLTFLGIGAAKSGTTTLASLISEHPEISFPRSGQKELHFFDEEPVNPETLQKYFDSFDTNRAIGEFTPSYMFDTKCRDLIYDTLGEDIKFVVILRNPVDRAYSHYCNAVKLWGSPEYRKRGYPVESLSFEDAIDAEPARLAEGRYHIRHLSYVSKGFYAKQLNYYFEKFRRENFLICLTDDLANEPGTLLGNIYRFLNVDSGFRPADMQIRKGSFSDGQICRETRGKLMTLYEEDLAELAEILNRNLDSWNHE